jgi:TPR repeat protein
MEKANQALKAGDDKTAFADYLAAAQKGDPLADVQIADMYSKGLGVVPDETLARHWYEQSAVDGSNITAESLGDSYFYPQKGAPDYQQAARWYRLAADRRDTLAWVEMSVLYEHGLGVAKDEDQALHWLDKFIGQTNIIGQKTHYMYAGGDNTGGFIAAVRQVVFKAAQYTPEVHAFHGVTNLSFRYQDGRAVDVTVTQSSGDPQADAAAVYLLKGALLPPVLPSLSHAPEFSIGINFGLASQRPYGSEPAH